MQTSALNLLGVQFLSRPVIREDLLRFGAKVTASQGLSLTGTLTIKFGNPLLEAPANWTPGPGGSSKNVRPKYTQPWQSQEPPSGSHGQFADPYAELRWPAYALTSFELANPDAPIATLEVSVQCDFLQALRAKVSAEILELPEIAAMTDQVVANEGYRLSYWTPLIDPVGNPGPVETGEYIHANRREPIGPGFTAIRGTGFTGAGAEYCSLALVWSQAFSFPDRASARVDEPQIQKRVKDLKLQFGAKEDLKRADDCQQRQDTRGCILSAQTAVESALRFYCMQWGVRTPSLPGIEFHQKVDRILKRAGRPSYQAVDSAGLIDLLHLYRASLKAHGNDCSYHDEQLHKEVRCEQRHALQFLDAAIKFTFWLDSQA